MFNAADIAERIREQRRALGLTQAELAQRAGTSVPTIARIEGGGAGSVSFETMVRILNMLGYSIFLEKTTPAEVFQPSAEELEAYLDGRYFGAS